MCLLAALIILAYRFFAPSWRIPKWLVLVFQLFPLVFVFFYIGLYTSGQYIGSNLFGKDFFSGREELYITLTTQLKKRWTLGYFGEYSFENAHNGPLTILMNVGVLGYSAYLWFMNYTIRTYHRRISTYSQTIALMVLLAIFVHSSGEAAMTVSGANYSILCATVFWMLKGADHDSEITI